MLPLNISLGRVSDGVSVWSLHPRRLVPKHLNSVVVWRWETELLLHKVELLARVLEGTDVPTS
jgi:hypothetical protein